MAAAPGEGCRGLISSGDLLERAAALRRAGRPFALATVVRSLRPASARPGDRALLTTDGPMLGWIGGGCVHTAVEREAAAALVEGAPRLLRFSPAPADEDGIVSLPMTCHSGGTLDIYVEPVLPAPELVVLGGSAVTDALVKMAEPLGFRVLGSLDELTSADVWVVAAGMSSGEDHPLVRDALLRGVQYVAMVSSPRRAAVFVEELRAEGIADEVLKRLKAPAGIHIGAANPPEIALSILAEIVQRRRSHTTAFFEPPAQRPVAIDPICGMEVPIAGAKWTAVKDGETFYFCAPGCRKAFIAAA